MYRMVHRTQRHDVAADTQAAERAARRLLVVLAAGGTAHFVAPSWFDSIIPPVLPGDARAWTYLSGASALGIAGALAHPRTRRRGGQLATVFLVAVWPTKVQLSINWLRDDTAGPAKRVAAILHYPWQSPLIQQALAAQRYPLRQGRLPERAI